MRANGSKGDNPTDSSAHRDTDYAVPKQGETRIVATTDGDLAFGDTAPDAPPHAEAVLAALREHVDPAEYDAGATVARMDGWILHSLEVEAP